MENGALVQQLLAWIEERPRTYDETMDAWKTSCPRLSVWEDAVAEGLISIENQIVKVSNDGKDFLEQAQ